MSGRRAIMDMSQMLACPPKRVVMALSDLYLTCQTTKLPGYVPDTWQRREVDTPSSAKVAKMG